MDKQYVWGVRYIDELICRDDADNATTPRLYATQDANFNLTSIVSTTGSVAERYLFDPYGNRIIMNGSWANIAATAYNWFVGNQGLLHDVNNGLIYCRVRNWNPVLGRANQRDPLGYINSGNLYEYLLGNPFGYVDPFGLAVYDDPKVPPSLTDTKGALKSVYDVVGKQPAKECKIAKFGSPMRGDTKLGYRLDPPHGPSAPPNERVWHINYWDYTDGKRGSGGKKGAIPIGEVPPESGGSGGGGASSGGGEGGGAGGAAGGAATALGSAMVLGAAEGLNAFGGDKHCQAWYQNTMESILAGTSCNSINSGNNFTECKSALQTKIAEGGGILAGGSAVAIGEAFQKLADYAQDACNAKSNNCPCQ